MADEKQATNVSESQLSRSDDDGQEIAWTEDEEKALVRRYALHEDWSKGASRRELADTPPQQNRPSRHAAAYSRLLRSAD